LPSRRPKVFAIIPAAGSGTRLGTPVRKQFLPLKGKPILVHTVQQFEHCPDVDEIAIAVPESALVEVESFVSRYRLHKVSKVIAGGDLRQDSVFNVMRVLSTKDADIVVVHDGVRPFIDPKKITQVIHACREHGAAVLAVQPKDTVRRSGGGGFFDATLDRTAIWMVQTPQAFKAGLLRKAFQLASKERFTATDEAGLVEHAGHKARIVEGTYDNIKITTVEDLELGQLIHERLHGAR
jgi:2-C-methyl-D-erythritol 4-phosphate cytidylyltransferase